MPVFSPRNRDNAARLIHIPRDHCLPLLLSLEKSHLGVHDLPIYRKYLSVLTSRTHSYVPRKQRHDPHEIFSRQPEVSKRVAT